MTGLHWSVDFISSSMSSSFSISNFTPIILQIYWIYPKFPQFDWIHVDTAAMGASSLFCPNEHVHQDLGGPTCTALWGPPTASSSPSSPPRPSPDPRPLPTLPPGPTITRRLRAQERRWPPTTRERRWPPITRERRPPTTRTRITTAMDKVVMYKEFCSFWYN